MSGFTVKRFVSFFLIILGIIILDHSLKHWVVIHLTHGGMKEIIKHNILSLLHVQNSGFILGIDIFELRYLRIFSLAIKFSLLFFASFYVFKNEEPKKTIKMKIVAGAFIVGGGFSNCIDWLFNGFLYSNALYYNAPFKLGYGNVIDMIYLPFTQLKVPSSWPIIGGLNTCFPIFNIADIFVVTGLIMALVVFVKEENAKEKKKIHTNKTRVNKRRINSFQRSRTRTIKKKTLENKNKKK